jgi:hypothetical protein
MPRAKGKEAIRLSDIAAMELREREGYLRHPQTVEESLFWEEQAVWSAEEGENIRLFPRKCGELPKTSSRAPLDATIHLARFHRRNGYGQRGSR